MVLSSNIIQIDIQSTKEVCKSIAARVKSRRLELNLTQIGIAERADVNIETYRRFERTGEISFHNLVKLALALNVLTDFDFLFSKRQFQSIDELLRNQNITRKRGKKT